jgi:hypothetical protein
LGLALILEYIQAFQAWASSWHDEVVEEDEKTALPKLDSRLLPWQ